MEGVDDRLQQYSEEYVGFPWFYEKNDRGFGTKTFKPSKGAGANFKIPFFHHAITINQVVQDARKPGIFAFVTAFGIKTTAEQYYDVPNETIIDPAEDNKLADSVLYGGAVGPSRVVYKDDRLPDQMQFMDYQRELLRQSLELQETDQVLETIASDSKKVDADIEELTSGAAAVRLRDVNSKIELLYFLCYPDGQADTTLSRLHELLRYPGARVDLYAALKTIKPEATNVTNAVDDISTEVMTLEAEIRKPDPIAASLAELRVRLSALEFGPLGYTSCIGKTGMQATRTELLTLMQSVPDFQSELEVIGFVNNLALDEESRLSEKIRARDTAVDPYKELRQQLRDEYTRLSSAVSVFKCDTSDLRRRLASLKTKKIRKDAEREYNALLGAAGKPGNYVECLTLPPRRSATGTFRSRWQLHDIRGCADARR